MKKQNRNIFAYIRQPNVHLQQETSLQGNDKLGKSSSNPTMFNQIVGQMDHHLTSYLNKLVTKNQKQQEKKKSMQKSNNHQRTKSYADIHIVTPSGLKNSIQKGHSHRGSHPSTQINNIFFSLNNTPTNQKPTENKSQSKQQNNDKENQFLQTLDQYISDLSTSKQYNQSKSELNVQQEQAERKTIQKTRQNSSDNLKIIQKLQNASKNEKKLLLTLTIVQNENKALSAKVKKLKSIFKKTHKQLSYQIQSLVQQNKILKKQNRKFSQFLKQFQSKCSNLRPQRKTYGGAKPQRLQRNDEYLFSQTTQQDDGQIFMQYHTQNKKQNSMKRKGIPRSTAKQSRVSGFQVEQISAYLASKNLGAEDDLDSQVSES